MNTIGKLRTVLLAAILLLALMVYHTLPSGAWKGRADEAGKKVETGVCFVDIPGLRETKEQVVLLRFGETADDSLLQSLSFRERQMDISDLANRVTVKELRASEGRLVVVAPTRAEAMKAWIMLQQLGVENLFILSAGEGYDEVLKHRFRPVVESRPEP